MSFGCKLRLTGLLALGLLLQTVAVGAAAQATRVESVEVISQGETTGLLIAADGELEYRVMTQEEPPRVLIQLPGVQLSPDELPEPSEGGLIRTIRHQSGDGGPPHLELGLARAANANASRQGNALRVLLEPQAQATPAANPAAGNGNNPATGPARIRDFSLARADGETQLELAIEGEPERFQSFQLEEPPRVVVDLYGTGLGLDQAEHAVDHPFVDRVRFGEEGNRVRLVLDLRERVTHAVEPTSQGLQISLTRPSAQEGVRRVEDVDFTTGAEEDMARLTLDMDRTGAEVQVRREQDRVVMDLPRTELPERLQKRLVVTDFGTVVDTVDLYQRDDSVRVVASGEGPLRPRTYQVEDRLVLDVSEQEPQQAARGPAAVGEPYKGEKLSLNFQDIQVRQALQILAEFADLNIIASESVGGTLTLRLQDVPWDQALDLILDSQGLGMERQGNVIRVAPRSELQQQREQQLKAELQKQQLVPLQTEIVQVNYAKASEMKSLLEAQGEGGDGPGQAGMLSERGSISIDARTNSLLVRDTPSQIRKIQDMVEKLDRPTEQVMIEARIVNIDTDYERNLGVRWGGLVQEGSDSVSGTLAGAQGGTPDLAVDLPAAGAAGGGPATLGARIGSIANNTTLDLELSAIEAEGEGKVISSPRVVTANQQEATIEQGTEIPFQEATSSGATSVSFQEAVLSLSVTPQITPDGRLIMDVNATNDTVGQNTQAGPAIDTEEIETQVLVDNGETVVLGGIYTQDERTDDTGVPFFRDIPGLGWLFKTKAVSEEKSELLIFLTPRIIEEELGEAGAAGAEGASRMESN